MLSSALFDLGNILLFFKNELLCTIHFKDLFLIVICFECYWEQQTKIEVVVIYNVNCSDGLNKRVVMSIIILKVGDMQWVENSYTRSAIILGISFRFD